MNGCGTERARPRRPRSRGGFVLLMSLVLIALAGVLLVGLARHGLLVATEAREARLDLQRRWGAVFLSRSLLWNPESLISRHLESGDGDRRLLPLSETLRLGECSFRVTLDDENRKLNVNRLCAVAGTQELSRAIRAMGGDTARIALKPAAAGVLGVRPYDSWGHVLEIEPADGAASQFDQIADVSQVMTCWGNAKINIHRCEETVLRYVGELTIGLTAADHLLALREDEPLLDTSALLDKLAVNHRKRALLQGWLCDQSSCYSLWILASDRRSSLDLYICENSGSESPTIKGFRW